MSLTPSTAELVALGAPTVLRDGSHVGLLQGRSSDRQLLLRGFERLSFEPRYRQFLVAMPELSEEKVRYLTEIDHHDHEFAFTVARSHMSSVVRGRRCC